MAIALSGSLVITGSIFATQGITGSFSGNATSASYADTLGGLPSSSFAPAATFNTVSQSFAFTSGSLSGRVTLIEGQYATTGSNTFTGPQYVSQASNAISFTSTASLYTDGGLRVAKDSFVSGTAYFNNITVYGTSSIQYITSSQVNIGSNVITVNTDTPAIRFGGLSVFDSGSTGLTGSLFWDSEKNHWIYSNPSGSAYNSAMLMNGPRNTGSLGTEQGTLNNYVMKGQGGDHITSSQMIDDGTTVQIPGNLQVTGSIVGSSTAAFASTVTVNGSNLAITPTTATTYALSVMTNTGGYLRIGRDTSTGALYGDAYAGLVVSSGAYPLIFGTNDTERFRISSTGAATFSSSDVNIKSADPSITLTPNSGTYVFFQKLSTGNGDYLRLYDGTNYTMFWKNQQVGIGTGGTFSTYMLDVNGTGRFSGNVGIGGSTNVALLTITGNAGTSYAASANIHLYDTSSNAASRNWAIGNGIGTASYGELGIMVSATQNGNPVSGTTVLKIASTGAATFSSSVQVNGAATSTPLGVKTATNQNWRLLDNSGAQFDCVNDALSTRVDFRIGSQLYINANGSVGIGNTSSSYKLDIDLGSSYVRAYNNAAGWNFYALGNFSGGGQGGIYTGAGYVGMFSDGAYELSLGYNKARTMNFTSGGNVGIGTVGPSYKLHIEDYTSSPILFVGGGATNGVSNGIILLQSGRIPQSGGDTTGENGLLFQQTISGGTIVNGGYIYNIRESVFGSTASVNTTIAFGTTLANVNTERMRITSSGGVGIGTTSVTGTTKLRVISVGAANGDPLFFSDNNIYNAIGIYSAGADGYNGAATVQIIGRNTSTSRSINAGGTINASGADYAEYMTKAIEDTIAKGDIVGVNLNGLLTNVFADSISFVVKSTDPSYVGGDTWGSVDIIGKLDPEASEEGKAEYNTKLEVERAKVDRIAFSGQVPCNVTGANVGDYIIPIELENGKIGGQAITNPTFEQYQISVGKVWKIMENGKAWIAVKIG